MMKGYKDDGHITNYGRQIKLAALILPPYPSMQTTANTTSWTLDKHGTNPHEAFFFVECICNAWFTIEFFIR